MAEAFIPNPSNLPQVNHKNEVKTDNRVENLEWCDARYNVNYGTGMKRCIENVRKTNIASGRWKDYSSMTEEEIREYKKERERKKYRYEKKYDHTVFVYSPDLEFLLGVFKNAAEVAREYGVSKVVVGQRLNDKNLSPIKGIFVVSRGEIESR